MTFHINQRPSELQPKKEKKINRSSKGRASKVSSVSTKKIRRNTRNLLLF